ncbi:G-protein alpha subunit-domain-containing protein [Xylaria intraflava]|nr:G-protein alpha subunit-domain-containing protein [Xylaria intraflava]
MDPATIFQIVGTVISLGDVVIKCISKLSAIKAQYHDAPLIITAIIGQLHMVKAAQDQLSPLNTPSLSHDPRYRQLAGHIGNALDSFSPILHALAQQLDRYEGVDQTEMTAQLRLSFLHAEREMRSLSELLDRQVNALNLLLQAIQCQTWAQQTHIIDQTESQSILRLAQDCSSSLMGLDDVASFISDNTESISTRFEFDNVLQSTSLYQAAERSHLRQAIRANRTRQDKREPTNDLTSTPATFSLRQATAQAARSGWSGAASTAQLAALTAAQFRSSIDPFRAIKSGKVRPPELPAFLLDTLDDASSQGISVRRELTVKYSQEDTTIDEGSSPTVPSHNSSGGSDGASSSTQSGRPTRPLSVEKIGLGTWRKALSRRKFNGHESRPHQQIGRLSDEKATKVLLLGPSGVGKTTLLNSLEHFAEDKHTVHDEDYLRRTVWKNALESVRAALETVDESESDVDGTTGARGLLFHPYSYAEGHPTLNPRHAAEVARAVSNINFDTTLRHWKNSYQFPDNMAYYIKNIHQYAAVGGSGPTVGDLLRTQATTTGMYKAALKYKGSEFHVYDFGGKRSERKKWFREFESVSTLVVPVDPTGYGKTLLEDQNGNRMLEQFMLFETIMNSHWFSDANIIVPFTKMDLLEDYMKVVNVDVFLREAYVIPDGEPPVSTVESYLYHLEEYLKRLIRSDEIRERVRFIRVNLVDIDTHNSATTILDALESSRLAKRISIPRKSTTVLPGANDRMSQTESASPEVNEPF